MRDFCGELFQDLEKVAPLKGNLEELLGGGQMVAQLRRRLRGPRIRRVSHSFHWKTAGSC